MNILSNTALLTTVALSMALASCSMTSKNMAPEPAPAPIATPEPTPEPLPEPTPPPAPKYVIEDVHFDFDRAELRPSAHAILDQVAVELRQQPGIAYEVAGFTCSIGPASYNQGLSERRARAVRDYLVSHGADAGQLTTRGYGESNPIASNDTAEGRSQNRRVEIRPLG